MTSTFPIQTVGISYTHTRTNPLHQCLHQNQNEKLFTHRALPGAEARARGVLRKRPAGTHTVNAHFNRDAGADPRRPATRRHAPVPPKARTRDRYTRVVPAHTRVSFRSHRRLFLSRVPCFFPASRGFAPSRKTSLTQPNSDPTSPRRRPRSTTRLRRYTTPRRRATFPRSARFCELARGLTSATPRARPL